MAKINFFDGLLEIYTSENQSSLILHIKDDIECEHYFAINQEKFKEVLAFVKKEKPEWLENA